MSASYSPPLGVRKSPTGYRLKPGPSLDSEAVAAHQTARLFRAMTEIVAEHGYEAVKVRELVKLAGVSTKTFYRHFDSKEDCFLRTYEMVIRRARGGLLASQLDEDDWRERTRLIFAAFSRGVETDPAVARLTLVAAYAGSPAVIVQAQLAEDTFAAMIGASLARAPGGVVVPPMVIEGMMSGIGSVARHRLLTGRQSELPGMESGIMEWAMCFPSEAAAGLAALDLGVLRGGSTVAFLTSSPGGAAGTAPSTSGDRATILAAVGKLVAADGYKYSDLTVPRVRAAAGVSRRTFNGHFDDVEECFLAALEGRAAGAVTQAARAQISGSTWGGGVYRALSAFCIQIAGDPLLARVCFRDDFAIGSKGSLARLRLVQAVSAQLRDSAPSEDRLSELAVSASGGAIWGLLHRHVLRDWVLHYPEIAASLSYMALAPVLGADAAVAAIRDEQQT